MKTSLTLTALSLVLSTQVSEAAPATEYKLRCTVSTNGDGRDWKEIASLEADVKEFGAGDSETLNVVSPYGDRFRLSVHASSLDAHGLFTLNIAQDIHALNNSIILHSMDMGTETPKLTGNFADTVNTFTVKRPAGKLISYTASCAIQK